MSAPPILSVEGYTLDYGAGRVRALQDSHLSVEPGQVLGLVGESGSGKTSLAYAIMRYLPGSAVESGGPIRLAGQDLRALTPRQMRAVRGRRIGMVFQDPSASLNPTLTLGEQVMETLRRHKGLRGAEARDRAEQMLGRVGLKHPAVMLRRYPHEASGGEKQRVVIATAFAAEPECLLLDEPTTALDVITARQILDLFAELQAETKVATLYISHDLALVSRVADEVAVLHRGLLVERDPASQVFRAPREDYTRRLVAAVPRPDRRLVSDDPGGAPVVLAAEGLTVRYGRPSLLGRLLGTAPPPITGAHDVSFALRRGEILGIVGESGSGKSTIARALVGLAAFEGRIRFGTNAMDGVAAMDRAYRRAVQIVFQHPDASLNPRQRIAEILSRPLVLHGGEAAADLPGAVAQLLEEVGLPADFAVRWPHELSGGQKQRVAIARAFAARPSLVICDEITSSLDVSVQAQIVQLLLELRRRHGTAYLFITHDLNLVRQIAHRIAVMYRGDLVEMADAAAIGGEASHAYTRDLLAAVPTPAG
jgi:peptide/nickel transport system ATP-binding protein